MTQKEIHEFLANTKVYVNGKSKEIQEKLFSLGWSWNDDSTGTNVCHTEAPFLFIDEDTSIVMCFDMVVFCNQEYEEITAEEILSLELTEPKYRPFETQEECWEEMLKHQPFGWLKAKNSGNVILIGSVSMSKEVWIVWATDETESYSASKVFNNYVFADGTPFGIKEK